MELDGRVALVTGAGTRVGRVIALALGSAGMRVGVHYAGSEKGARQTAEEIIAIGSDARTRARFGAQDPGERNCAGPGAAA